MPAPAEPKWLEVVNPDHPRGPFRCVVFDFDGTLSLLRGNWQGLMVPMMVEALAATGTGESTAVLTDVVEEFVTRLTGQPTLQQMEALAGEIAKRGQARPNPAGYLLRYLDQLLSRTAARIEAVEAGRSGPDEFLVPGARPLVEALAARGHLLVIASGTEWPHVVRETAILRLTPHFGERVFGPLTSNSSFSKETVLRELMAEHGIRGEEIVAIGDGPAEMLAVKAVGGLAVGVASDEVAMSGQVNRLKREHLLRSGADLIVPDYRRLNEVLAVLDEGPCQTQHAS